MREFLIVPCPSCDGTGEHIVAAGPEQCDTDHKRCEECNGTGRAVLPVQHIEMDDDMDDQT